MFAARLDSRGPAASDRPARAAWLADVGLAAALDAVRYGAQPAAIAQRGVDAMRSEGARSPVLSVRPARAPADAPLDNGVLVRLSASGTLDGQPLAAARTTIVGYDTLDAQLAIGRAVLRARTAALAAIRTGAGAADVARAATDTLAAAAGAATDTLAAAAGAATDTLAAAAGAAIDSGAADGGAEDTAAEDSGAADRGTVERGAADTRAADTGTTDTGAADNGAPDPGGVASSTVGRRLNAADGHDGPRLTAGATWRLADGDVLLIEVAAGDGPLAVVVGDMVRVVGDDARPLSQLARRLWL